MKQAMIRDLRAWLVLTGLVVAMLPAHGQEPAPPPPERNPAPSAQPAAESAEPAPEEEPDLPGEQATVAWEDTEVGAAQTACVEMLDGVSIDYELLDPIKKGICGTPAPILVKSIGADPAVVISPPATMTCELAVALGTWVKETLQPAASVLGSRVVKVRNALSYECRNRYGGANTTISEHALANALDISEFVFASGQRIKLLGNWPYGAKDVALPLAPTLPLPNPHRVAAADDAASRETTGAIVTVSTRRSAGSAIVSVANAKTNPFVSPSPRAAQPPLSPLPRTASAAGSESQAHSPIAKIKANPFISPLPAPGTAPPAPEPVEDVEAEAETESEAQPEAPPRRRLEQEEAGAFLRAVHADACKTFETVLGPDANAAHKDHFHFDMKKRRYVKICDSAVRN